MPEKYKWDWESLDSIKPKEIESKQSSWNGDDGLFETFSSIENALHALSILDIDLERLFEMLLLFDMNSERRLLTWLKCMDECGEEQVLNGKLIKYLENYEAVVND